MPCSTTETPGSGIPLAVTVPVTVCWAKSDPTPKVKKDKIKFNNLHKIKTQIITTSDQSKLIPANVKCKIFNST